MLGGWFLLVLLAPVSASASGSASAVVTTVPAVLESDGVCYKCFRSDMRPSQASIGTAPGVGLKRNPKVGESVDG